MVDVMGHVAIAVLWGVPAWALWEGRVALAFVALAVTTAMLPDVDLLLRAFLPVQHHGITHTVVFVTALAFDVGAVIEYGFRSLLERRWLDDWGYAIQRGTLLVFVVSGLLLGGYQPPLCGYALGTGYRIGGRAVLAVLRETLVGRRHLVQRLAVERRAPRRRRRLARCLAASEFSVSHRWRIDRLD